MWSSLGTWPMPASPPPPPPPPPPPTPSFNSGMLLASALTLCCFAAAWAFLALSRRRQRQRRPASCQGATALMHGGRLPDGFHVDGASAADGDAAVLPEEDQSIGGDIPRRIAALPAASPPPPRLPPSPLPRCVPAAPAPAERVLPPPYAAVAATSVLPSQQHEGQRAGAAALTGSVPSPKRRLRVHDIGDDGRGDRGKRPRRIRGDDAAAMPSCIQHGETEGSSHALAGVRVKEEPGDAMASDEGDTNGVYPLIQTRVQSGGINSADTVVDADDPAADNATLLRAWNEWAYSTRADTRAAMAKLVCMCGRLRDHHRLRMLRAVLRAVVGHHAYQRGHEECVALPACTLTPAELARWTECQSGSDERLLSKMLKVVRRRLRDATLAACIKTAVMRAAASDGADDDVHREKVASFQLLQCALLRACKQRHI
eukprot:jgi/Chlat1/1796/Chrsp135S02141